MAKRKKPSTNAAAPPGCDALVRTLVLFGPTRAAAAEFYDELADEDFEDIPGRVSDFITDGEGRFDHVYAWNCEHTDLAQDLEGVVKTVAPLGAELTIGDTNAYYQGKTCGIDVTLRAGRQRPRLGRLHLPFNGDYFLAMAELDAFLMPQLRVYTLKSSFENGWATHAVLRAAGWEKVRTALGDHWFGEIFLPPAEAVVYDPD